MNYSYKSLVSLALGVSTLALAGLAGSMPARAQTYGYNPQPTTAPAASVKSSSGAVWVKVATNSKLGKVLVNSKGLTLYHFDSDRVGHTACTTGCVSIWPPLVLPKGAKLKHASLPGKLSTIKRPDGTRQVTYNNWPLYRYSGDTAAGSTKGQGLFKLWWAATPKLTKLTKM